MHSQSIKNASVVTTRKLDQLFFLITLTLLCMAGLIGSDVYLPALPSIAESLSASQQSIQFTLGIYLFGLSVGQLIFGPLSDQFGRKKMVLLGMLIYCFASIACAFAQSYQVLLIARVLQAFGACSGLVIGRAIVADKYDSKEAGRIFATIFPFVGMSPALSPVIGGFISHHFGWRATFIFVAMYAAIVLLCVSSFVEETRKNQDKQKFQLCTVFKQYAKIITDKSFIAYACAPCAAYFAYFAYIAQSPFIFHHHGFSDQDIGFFYITLSLTYIIGSIVSKKCLSSKSLNKVIGIGFVVFNCGALLLAISGAMNLSLLFMVIAISILTLGNGFLIPLGTAGAISTNTTSFGYASGLLGFLQLGFAAISSSIIGKFAHNSISLLGLYLSVVTVVGLIIYSVTINKETQDSY